MNVRKLNQILHVFLFSGDVDNVIFRQHPRQSRDKQVRRRMVLRNVDGVRNTQSANQAGRLNAIERIRYHNLIMIPRHITQGVLNFELRFRRKI